MKILVVDDAADIRLILRKYLQDANHEVAVAEDGAQAWEMLQQQTFDTVISDWLMPHMDGLELCKNIRSHQQGAYVYVILLTGLATKDNMIQGLEAGADDFITKPINFDELQVRVNSAERVINSEASLSQKNQELDEAHRKLQEAHITLLTDLESAAKVQASLLPRPLRQDDVHSAWFYHPATLIGGDSFNHFFISEQALMFYSVDVSGHGISSALVSISVHNMLRNLITDEEIENQQVDFSALLEQKVTEFNRRFLAAHAHNHYFTMVLGVIDFSQSVVHLLQAGHPEPIFCHGQDEVCEVLALHGFPVGLVDEAEYQAARIPFHPGDKLIVYTDGLNEMTSAQAGQALELQQIQQHFQSMGALSAQQMIDTASQQWFLPEEMAHCPDDLSILIFQFS